VISSEKSFCPKIVDVEGAGRDVEADIVGAIVG
jgi:hypothetical protein